MNKPLNLQYGPADRSPAAVTLLAASQQVGLLAISMVVPVLLAQRARLSPAATENLLSLSMIALSVATLLQTLRFGPVGSGFLAASEFSAIYLGPTFAAVRTGGMALAAGMTMLGGATEAVLSRSLSRLRPFLPPELAGLVIFLVGVTTGSIGLSSLFEVGTKAPAPAAAAWGVAALTLATMIVLNVWTKGILRLSCTLIGVLAGYAGAFATGLVTPADFAAVKGTNLLALPRLGGLALSFDIRLYPAFAIAALAATLNAIGVIAACQRMTDAGWTRPDMTSLGHGVLADGLGTTLAGLLGTAATNLAPASPSLAAATGVASRRVAYATSGIMFLLAFCPPVTLVFTLMPAPVLGAVLLFVGSFILLDGVEAITARLLDTRRVLTIGLAIFAGTAVDLFPHAFQNMPALLIPFFSSSLVFGTLVGVTLNLLFRLGVRQHVGLEVLPAAYDPAVIDTFMETTGAAWGARREIVQRATFALQQLVEALLDSDYSGEAIQLEASFDEFNIEIRARYRGALLQMPERRPSEREIRETEDGHRRLAGFLLRRNADRVSASSQDGISTVQFHFDH